jgi:uncharacterized Tic20 family protein
MDNEKSLQVLPHVLGIFTGFIGPLVTLLISKDELKDHSKKALNWQLSLLIYSIVSGILVIVLVGLILLPVLMLLNLIFSIMAAVKASDSKLWDYPLSIKFLK